MASTVIVVHLPRRRTRLSAGHARPPLHRTTGRGPAQVPNVPTCGDLRPGDSGATRGRMKEARTHEGEVAMLAGEVMSSPAITLGRGDTVRRAIRVLYDHDITAAPVLGDHGELVGMVSEIDLLCGAFTPGVSAPATVADVMSRQVSTVEETTDTAVLTDLMIARRIKSVPVLRDERVVGIVSRRDLMALLARSDAELRDAVLAALRERYPSETWEVSVRNGEIDLRGPEGQGPEHVADLLERAAPGIRPARR
ncbi:CBS domain-containing protein [Microbispora amethystogenes]|nr:CBS domain-containing protein [Microbispora amethystogenes]